jgi:hypothetical protein
MDAMNHRVRLLDELIERALGPSAALAERRALTDCVASALSGLGQSRLTQTLVVARRTNPPRSAGGAELAISVTSHAAMTKMRLLAPELLDQLQQEIPDLRSVSITTQKSVQPLARPQAGPRPTPPAQAMARLRALYSQDH